MDNVSNITKTDDELKKEHLIEILHNEFMKNGISGQHIGSFNYFLTQGCKDIVTASFGTIGVKNMENKRSVTPEDQSIKSITFNVKITDWNFGYPVEIKTKTGQKTILTPNEARRSNKNYSSPCFMSVLINASATKHDGTVIEHTPVEVNNYPVGSLPIMVGSCKCHTSNMTKTELRGINEDVNDPRGYFITNGGERLLDSLENVANNVPQVHKNFYMNEIVRCEFISKYGVGFENSSQIRIKVLKGGAITLEIVITKLKEVNIPFYLIYRIFGMTRDYDIIKTIVYDVENKANNQITAEMIKILTEAMRVSIKKGKKSTETDLGNEDNDDLNNDKNNNTNNSLDDDDSNLEKDTSFNSVIDEINTTKLLEEIWNKTNDIRLKKTENNQKFTYKTMMDIFDKHFLPHIGNSESDRYLKLLHFGNLIRHTLLVLLDVVPSTDRDSEKNKLVQAAGITYAKAFKTQFNINIYIHVISALMKAFENKEFSKVNLAEVYKNSIKNSKDLELGMIKSITSGTPTIKIGNKQITNRTSSKVNDRRNSLANLAGPRSISAPGGSASKQSERAEGIREVHPRYLGKICIIQTQEGGEGVGMNKQMAYAASITNASSPHKLIELLLNEPTCISTEQINLEDIVNYIDDYGVRTGLTKIFVNGLWLTSTTKPNYIIRKYRYLRRFNIHINAKISIYKEENLNEIHFRTEAGRLTQPMVIVYNNLFNESYNDKTGEFIEFDLSNVTKKQYDEFYQYIKLTYEHIKQLRKKQITLEDLRIQGIIEYIDACEVDNHYYASTLNVLRQNERNFYKQYTHVDIEQALFGIPALTSPFIDHSPPNRTAFQTSQSRQTCGQYSSTFPFRTDKNMFYQSTCEQPICTTIANLYHRPNGLNVVVAITTNNGYNQEDSQITKKPFLDRGAFGGHYIHTVDDVAEKGESFGRPNSTNTSGIKKHSSYELLGDNGLARVGSIIKKGDVIIGKYATLNIATQNFKYTDKSVVHQSDEEVFVLDAFRSHNAHGKEIAKIVTIAYRRMATGDKTSARSGCKGINSHVMDDCDMPYTEDGIIPDFIINPTTFPSRMVCNQIIEMIISWIGIKLGTTVDCTSFKNFDLRDALQFLSDLGLKPQGTKRMFDGVTGEFIDAEIYVGFTYYQRLQKFIRNDAHANNNAPINATTRQPNKGVGKGGMVRLGEMEKDVIASHGSSHILSERMSSLSDGIKVPYCTICSNQCVVNEQYNYYKCNICGDNAKIVLLNTTWTAKLFGEHTRALHIKTERIFSPVGYEEIEGTNEIIGQLEYKKDNKSDITNEVGSGELTEDETNKMKALVNMKKGPKYSNKLKYYLQDNLLLNYFNELTKLKNQKPIITYDEIEGSMKYTSDEYYVPIIHNGQAKLFLSELKDSIDIFSKYGENSIIIYAGSSPSNKIYMLHELFPTFKFILIDPSETHIYIDYTDFSNRISHYKKDTNNIIYFRSLLDNKYDKNGLKMITYLSEDGPKRINRDLYTQDKHTPIDKAIDFITKSNYKIFIFEDFMNCELAKSLSVLPNIHFWSDIRTNSKFGDHVTDVDLLWNLAQQYNWVKELKPSTFMLKFRCPFHDVNHDIVKRELTDENKIYYNDIKLADPDLHLIENYDNPNKLTYLKGIIEIQQYQGKSSTETRLKGNTIELFDYNPIEFENKFMYYNKVSRWITHRVNKYVNERTKKFGYCHCNDCAVQSYIWQLYNDHVAKIDITSKIIDLNKVTGRTYKINGHGEMGNGYTKEKYNELYEKYSNKYID